MSLRRATAALAAAATLAALLVVVSPRPALSAGGALDTTFNTTGGATLDFGNGTDAVTDLVLQGDGKVVVAGPSGSGFGLARYTTAGALDSTFGVGGFTSSNLMTDARGLALQTDGKLVVAGRTAATNGQLVVARYTTAGVLDAGFDTDGRVATSALTGASSGGVDVAVQSDGKVVALAVDNGVLVVYRYLATGAADTSWGGDGRVDTTIAPSLNDRIAVVGTTAVVVAGGDDVLRLAIADGAPDATFDTDGTATTANHVIRALAVQSDGKPVVGGDLGATNTQAMVVRYTTAGALDATWGTGGVTLFAVSGLTDPSVHALLVQSDGKVVVAGRQDDAVATSTIFLARLTTAGVLDTTFATGGVQTFATVAAKSTSTADALAVDSTGRYVVGGAVVSASGVPNDNDFLVFRVLPTDTPAATTTTTTPGHTLAGATARSDAAETVPSSTNKVVATVTTPTAGVVTFVKEDGTTVTGYRTVAGITVTAPSATAANPLQLSFDVDVSSVPTWFPTGSITVLRNGVAVAPCTAGATATPDPCVASRSRTGNLLSVRTRASAASTWQFARQVVQRIAGASRVESAIAASRSTFVDDGAGAVVLARSDSFADALAATPFAVDRDAPLLLTDPSFLDDAALVEILRVLPPGGTVYMLGGPGALSPTVEDRLLDWGLDVERIAGADRFQTAVAIAEELGSPDVVVETTGFGFADALAAGAVAVELGGAVLLTAGAQPSSATLAYLAEHDPDRYAIGGPAAVADPDAEAIVGEDRYETAVLAALEFFPQIDAIGFASGTSFADALAGGTHAGHAGAPLVLLPSSGTLPVSVEILLRAESVSPPAAFLYGGSAAVAEDILTRLRTAFGG